MSPLTSQIGPFAVIYEIWRTSAPARSSAPVPIWILVFGGAWIVMCVSRVVTRLTRAAASPRPSPYPLLADVRSYGYNIMCVRRREERS